MVSIDGFQGKFGNTGKIGPTGIDGNIGYQGISGNIGLSGTIGQPGLTGPIGLKGSIGPSGLSGKNGSTGPTGPIGNQGRDGPQGPPGSLTRGPNGKNGYDGLLTTLQKNQVMSILSGQANANNLVAVSGNPINGIIHCPIVMGKENAIANGIIDAGNGIRSLNCTYVQMVYKDSFYSPDGYYRLNESFDQNNLIGSNGPQGYQGPPGLIGVQGRQGIPGLPGKMGKPGKPGNPGMDGPIGFKGLLGISGSNGNDGPIGITGDQGPNGPIGQMGKTGPSYVGPQGYSGYSGSVSIDFPKCLAIQMSTVAVFDCPNDYWLTSLKKDGGVYGGLCCPLTVGDNNEPTNFDVGIDGNKYQSPNLKSIEKTYNKDILDSIVNRGGMWWGRFYGVNNNDNNIRNENKTNVSIGTAQSYVVSDLVKFSQL
jgi:hypothetical protein